MGEWAKNHLGDLISLEYGKGLKDYDHAHLPFPVYGTNGKIGTTNRSLYDLPSVIIGRKGAYRGVHLASSPFWVIDTAFYIKRDEAKIDNDFLYYWLKGININRLDTGSAIPSTSREDIYNLEILLPKKSEQKAIVSVLSSLDDKIDLLHRQNKTLEDMAQTLFRQWFVEEAEEGWEDGVLGDLIGLKYGKALKKTLRTGKGYPVVGSSSIVDYHSEYLVEQPGIVIGRKGTLGEVIYLSENFYPIDTTFYVQTKISNSTLFFEYFLLKSLDLKEMNTDSAVPGLNRNIAHAISIKIPTTDSILNFNKYIDPLFNKIFLNKTQIKSLKRIRNILLPKLMSGKLRVEY